MTARAFDTGTDQLPCALAEGVATITLNRPGVRIELSDAFQPDLIERAQGLPPLKGVPCRMSALPDAEVRAPEAQFVPTDRLPLVPEGRWRGPASGRRFHGEREACRRREFEAVALAL